MHATSSKRQGQLNCIIIVLYSMIRGQKWHPLYIYKKNTHTQDHPLTHNKNITRLEWKEWAELNTGEMESDATTALNEY